MTSTSSASLTPDTLLVRAPGVAARIVEGDAVIVQPGEGLVTVLNPVGSRIWERMETPRTPRELAEALSAEFEVSPDQALSDVLEFLADLRDKGLVVE